MQSLEQYYSYLSQLFHLLEVLWPVLLYATLAILRSKFPPVAIPDCELFSCCYKASCHNNCVCTAKYRAFALPSAGTLPFIQSLFCDFGTKEDTMPFSDMPTFPNATYVLYLREDHNSVLRWSVCDI